MLHDPRRFPFTTVLEAGWHDVRAELDALRDEDFFPWYERDGYEGDWKICGVHVEDHPDAGRLSADVVRRCPATVALVRAVPGVNFGAFSLMGPRAMIHPHRDGGPRMLRCHLGLRVPPGCRFRMGEQDVTWEEGRCLVFDGSTQHAAWNHSGEPRVVLIVDFRPEAHGL